MQFEEFALLLAWWHAREEGERAWRIPVAELLANGCNLDRKNPHAKVEADQRTPEEIVASLLAKEEQVAAALRRIQALLAAPDERAEAAE